MIINEEKELNTLKRKVFLLCFILLWIAFAYVVFQIANYFSEILNALALATLINYLLAGPVSFLTRFIRYRVLSVLLIYLTFVAGIAFLIYSLLPTLSSQAGHLKESIPLLFGELDNLFFNLNLFLQTNYQISLPVAAGDETQMVSKLLVNFIKSQMSNPSLGAGHIVSSSVNIGLYGVMTIVLSFYLLVDGKRAWDLFMIPFENRLAKHISAIKSKIDRSLHAFVAGQFQIASLTSLVMLITYVSLGIPYSVLFAIVQMLEIIPLIGTWTAIIPCTIIIFVTNGPNAALIAFSVYLIYTQVVRDNFVAPRIMGDALGFHPLSIIVAVIIGAKLGGAMGVIFALPLLAIMTSFIDYNLELSKLKVPRHDI